jgi:hypothetical protein
MALYVRRGLEVELPIRRDEEPSFEMSSIPEIPSDCFTVR